MAEKREGKSTGAGGPRGLQILTVSLLVLLVGFGLLLNFAYRPPSIAPQLNLDQVYDLATKGQIRSAKLLDEDAIVIGQKCISASKRASAKQETPVRPEQGAPSQELRAEAVSKPEACSPPVKPFQASYPRSDVFTQQLIERMVTGGAQVVVDKQTGALIIKLLLTFMFPLLVLANLFGMIFLYRSGESSMADIAGFGKLGRRRKKEATPGTVVTFANVGGATEAVTELREVTDYLKDPKKFEAYGAAAPKGVLLFGPPGCGKTLLARAVAGEAGVPFFSVSGAEFIESLVGVGAARVRDLFRQVREVAPAIVFIDEIDAVGRKRSGEGATGGEREQTVNQLLVELDGFEVSAGIVLMGATNRPDILDPALLRPGRFDRHVTLEAPDIHGRQEILDLHGQGKPLEGVDLEDVARRTPGFTGADLANVINEAALLAIREGEGVPINPRHMSEAIQRVLHGPQRRGKLMSTEERKRLAYHESGHVLVAAALGQAEAVQRVSIIATGRGLGASAMSVEADRVLLAPKEMRDTLTITMAGMAAEQLMFGDHSTMARDDLARANGLAREMVGVHGMSPEIGPLVLLSADKGYLGSEAGLVETISGQTMAIFDEEVKKLMQAAEQAAFETLSTNKNQLDNLAEALEEQESLEGSALEVLLASVGPNLNARSTNGDSRPGRPGPKKPPRTSASTLP